MMREFRREVRGRAGRRGPRGLWTSVRLCLFAGIFAAVLVGAVTTVEGDQESPQGEAGVSLRIARKIKVLVASAIQQPPYPARRGNERLLADVLEVTVSTNTSVWGLNVRLALPEGRAPSLETGVGAATCRLLDERGTVVQTGTVVADEAFLWGNGQRGTQKFYVEIVEIPADTGPLSSERPPKLVVEVEGWCEELTP